MAEGFGSSVRSNGMKGVELVNTPLLSASNPEMASAADPLKGRFYTVTQAAKILGLPTTWIYERTRKDAIPHRKLGKYVRFTASDLAAILATCSRGPRSEVSQVNKGES